MALSDCIRPLIPQVTEWKHIGNQIDAAMNFARTDFVKSCNGVREALPYQPRFHPVDIALLCSIQRS